MELQIREHIISILNKCWNDSLDISPFVITDREIEEVLLFIKNNRIEGYLYRGMQESDHESSFFQCVQSMYNENLHAHGKIMDSIKYAVECLKDCCGEYALVNGSFYISFICNPGERIQKDIDILVSRQKYPQIHSELIRHGFKQAIIENGIIREANRIEKVFAKNNNNYIIPYYKKCLEGNLGDVWIDVDISELNSDILAQFIHKNKIDKKFDLSYLDMETNIVYTCKIIYEKSKTYRYVIQEQDNVLYYFCELNQLLHNNFSLISWSKVYIMAEKMKMERAVYFTITSLLELLGASYSEQQTEKLIELLNDLNILDNSFFNRVYDEKNRKQYIYMESLKDWIFCTNRKELLKETEEENAFK